MCHNKGSNQGGSDSEPNNSVNCQAPDSIFTTIHLCRTISKANIDILAKISSVQLQGPGVNMGQSL